MKSCKTCGVFMFGAFFPSSSFVERRFVFPLPYVLGIIMQEHNWGKKKWLLATVVHDAKYCSLENVFYQ